VSPDPLPTYGASGHEAMEQHIIMIAQN